MEVENNKICLSREGEREQMREKAREKSKGEELKTQQQRFAYDFVKGKGKNNNRPAISFKQTEIMQLQGTKMQLY